MAVETQAFLGENGAPAVSCADPPRILVEPLRFLAPGEPGELGVQRVARVQESFLPVQDRRVSPVGVVVEAHSKRLKMHRHRRG